MTQRTMRGPVFIVGAPRSGTSLLRNVLNRLAGISLCDETYYFYYVYTRRRIFGDLAESTNRQRVVERYLATTRIERLQLDRTHLADELMREGVSYAAFFSALLRFYATAHGKHRWGEKTPQHTEFSETLCDWYPDCALIHLVRDPRDVVASLLRMPWGHRTGLANARLWMRCVAGAERCRQQPNFLRVRYEALVSDPAPELQRICDFIGEEYDPAILVPQADQPAHAWWFERARGAIAAERIETWRQQLTPVDVSLVEYLTGAYLEAFGYERSGPEPSLLTRAIAHAQDSAERTREKMEQLPRLWYHWVHPTQLAAEEASIDRHR